MFSISAVVDRLGMQKRILLATAVAVSLGMFGARGSAVAQSSSAPRDFSGWRGGIGITFGTPSHDIADVTEMGYEMVWGGEDPRAIKTLGISVFRYWNSIVETKLKGAGYDFSGMDDKEEAARLAFDAWMERTYGVKGLSKYATVRYHPKGAYGDVYGSMDLSSDNDLVKAVIDKYMQGFEKDGITHGGIGLDNAGKGAAGRFSRRWLAGSTSAVWASPPTAAPTSTSPSSTSSATKAFRSPSTMHDGHAKRDCAAFWASSPCSIFPAVRLKPI